MAREFDASRSGRPTVSRIGGERTREDQNALQRVQIVGIIERQEQPVPSSSARGTNQACGSPVRVNKLFQGNMLPK